jgi:thioredoxin 1
MLLVAYSNNGMKPVLDTWLDGLRVPGRGHRGSAGDNYPGGIDLAHPIPVSDQDFQQTVLSSPTPVLVDFWAEWCGPCHMIAPIIEQVAEEYADRLKVVKLDVDANARTAMRYQVQSIPTLIIFKDGREAKRLIGYMPKQRLTEEIKRVLEQTATA